MFDFETEPARRKPGVFGTTFVILLGTLGYLSFIFVIWYLFV